MIANAPEQDGIAMEVSTQARRLRLWRKWGALETHWHSGTAGLEYVFIDPEGPYLRLKS